MSLPIERFEVLERREVDGPCPACWGTPLVKVVYVSNIDGRITVDERVGCECGYRQD